MWNSEYFWGRIIYAYSFSFATSELRKFTCESQWTWWISKEEGQSNRVESETFEILSNKN